MNLKIFFTTCAFFAATSVFGVELFNDFIIQKCEIAVGNKSDKDVSINLAIFNSDWKSTSIGRDEIQNSGYPKVGAKSFEARGKIKMPDNKTTAEFTQKFELLKSEGDENTYRLDYDIEIPDTFKPNQIAFAVTSPTELSREGRFAIDDKKFVLPAKADSIINAEGNFNHKFSFATDSGIFTIEPQSGKFHIQDNRKWGWNIFALRVILPVQNGKCSASFKIKFEKIRSEKVTLGNSAKISKLKGLPTKPDFGKIKYFYNAETPTILTIAPNAKAVLNLPKNTSVLYLLNSFQGSGKLPKVVAEAVTTYPNAASKTIALGRNDTDFSLSKNPRAAVAWRGIQPNGKVQTLYSTKIAGIENASTITLINKTPRAWNILAATASNVNLTKNQLEGNIISADGKYFPITFTPGTEKGSALDFSFLLDAPAGKYGFAKAKGDNIEFENRPDVRVKFFGNNMTMMSNFPDKAIAPAVADAYARTGYNICRFHFYDNLLSDPKSVGGTGLNPDLLDKLDFFAAELKKRGVYFTTDLYIARAINPKSLESEFADIKVNSLNEIKSLFFLSQKARDNLKEYSKNLLNHVNPYTKLAWKDDPALVSISLVNEDTMMSVVQGSTAPIFQRRYAKWLEKNSFKENDNNSKILFARFLKELHSSFYSEMKTFLRSIGARQMLTDENHMSSIPQSLGADEFDIVDTHTYFGHPDFVLRSWQLPAKVKNTSSLKELGADAVCRTAVSIAGKPMSVTEWNHVTNNDTSAEGAIIMGAYGSMQGMDMLCRYTYRHAPHDMKPASLKYFDTDSNPILSLSERAAAAFLLRGDVSEAELKIPCMVSRDYFESSTPQKRATVSTHGHLYRRMCLIGSPHLVITDTPRSLDLPNAKFALVNDESWSNIDFKIPTFPALNVDDKTLEKISEILGGGLIDPQAKKYNSANGQIKMDGKNETLQVCTPKSEAFIGPKGTSGGGKFARFKNLDEWGAFFAAAIDGKTLAESSRILILHLSDVKNSGMRFGSAKKTLIWDMGKLPLLLRNAKAKIEISNPLVAWKCYALSPNGKRLGEVAIKRKDGKAYITAQINGKFAPTLAYELLRVKQK